jgi:hypothetical protein
MRKRHRCTFQKAAKKTLPTECKVKDEFPVHIEQKGIAPDDPEHAGQSLV